MGRKSNAQKAAEAAATGEITDEFGFDDAIEGADLELDNSDLPAELKNPEPPPADVAFDPFAPSVKTQTPTPPQAQKLPELTLRTMEVKPQDLKPAPTPSPQTVTPTTPLPRKVATTAQVARNRVNGAAGAVIDWNKVLPGLQDQIENIAHVLENRGTPKSARAIGHLGQALTWIKDDLRDLK